MFKWKRAKFYANSQFATCFLFSCRLHFHSFNVAGGKMRLKRTSQMLLQNQSKEHFSAIYHRERWGWESSCSLRSSVFCMSVPNPLPVSLLSIILNLNAAICDWLYRKDFLIEFKFAVKSFLEWLSHSSESIPIV